MYYDGYISIAVQLTFSRPTLHLFNQVRLKNTAHNVPMAHDPRPTSDPSHVEIHSWAPPGSIRW